MKIKLIALSLALLIFSGCSSSSVEEVFRMPELPREFAEFNDELNKIRNAGAEFIAPNAGLNRQSVQLTDLDNDGQDEGIAFFRQASNSYKVTVYIFKKVGDSYVIHGKIEGPGNAIESVSYADLLGNGNNEIVIGWSVSDSDARSLTVHEFYADGIRKVCEIPYQYYLLNDLNSDGVSDLHVVYDDPTNHARKIAMYTHRDGSFIFKASAPLSNSAEPIRKIRAGRAAAGYPAIFIETAYDDYGLITDVVIYREGKLYNITYDKKSENSKSTMRMYPAYCEDINGDGNLEIPDTIPLPGYEDITRSETFWGMLWRGYDEKRGLIEVAYTFHAFLDNWHIMLPMEWYDQITVKRVGNMAGESGMAFSSYQAETGNTKPLFTIYMLTGESRKKQADKDGRIKLVERSDVIYAAKIYAKSFFGYDISEAMLKERFHYREAEWTSGEVVS